MKPSLTFFGTGPVSLHCLEGIHEHFRIESIVTKPARIAPNGKPHAHPVKAWGEAHGIDVYEVADQYALGMLFQKEYFGSKIGLVVDFGLIISPRVIQFFEYGIVNSHFSLLPRLRGADPISFSILEGLTETGVSLMTIVEAMDEGPLLGQESFPIPGGITTPELTLALGELSNRTLIRDIPAYLEGSIKPKPQTDHPAPTYTRKLTKADGIIDWAKPALQLEREIRAFTPWPASRTEVHGREVIITAAKVVAQTHKFKPGELLDHDEYPLIIMTGRDALAITKLKPAGKTEMAAADFMRGVPR